MQAKNLVIQLNRLESAGWRSITSTSYFKPVISDCVLPSASELSDADSVCGAILVACVDEGIHKKCNKMAAPRR